MVQLSITHWILGLVGAYASRVGIDVACAALFVVVLAVLAFPCFLAGLPALPLCGAAAAFLAASKNVRSKENKQGRRALHRQLAGVPKLA
jgi:hypothetical protein